MTSYQSNGPVPNASNAVSTGVALSDPFITVFQTRDPTPQDFNYPIKKRWVNLTTTSEWILKGFNNQSGQSLAVWIELTAGANAILSISDAANVPVYPSPDTATPPNNIQLTSADSSILISANTFNHSLSLITNATALAAFSYYLASTATNVTGDGTVYAIGTAPNLLTQIFDQTANMSTAGVFTAKVAGNYMFIVNIRVTGLTSSDTFGQVRIVTTSNQYICGDLNPGAAATASVVSGLYTFNFSCMANMSMNDTASFTVQISGSTATVGVAGNAIPTTFIQGYLVR